MPHPNAAAVTGYYAGGTHDRPDEITLTHLKAIRNERHDNIIDGDAAVGISFGISGGEFARGS
jgi:hypothetical protein